jgi:hypothetical protein
MGAAFHTIPIQPAASACAPAGGSRGCGGCVQGASSGPVCRSALGEPCVAPALSGPADALARLRHALAPVLGALESGLVRALHVADGEVELQLALRADCGGAALADSAFQVLRSMLPDTDIYVLPAR